MTTNLFRSIKSIAKRLSALLITALMLFSLAQTPAIAVSSHPETFTKSGNPEFISDEKLNELKEQRREWQSQVSSANNAKEAEPDSLGETVKEKLNLEEITDNYQPDK